MIAALLLGYHWETYLRLRQAAIYKYHDSQAGVPLQVSTLSLSPLRSALTVVQRLGHGDRVTSPISVEGEM